MTTHTKTILLPIDGSDPSRKAALSAFRLARALSCEVICIHVITTPVGLREINPALAALYFTRAEEHARSWVAEIQKMAGEHGLSLKAEVVLRGASVPEAIIEYAGEHKVDLIIMGTRGRTGAKRVLLGSVASAVVEYASCPVLLVR